MLKVLLVDDESIFRKALRVKIDWASLGFEICGEARNGEEAVEKVLALKPDVALVDINMPVMDGLGFIEEIREMDIPLEFIILTGYSDFDYARQAIGLGIRNYLLKPVEEKKLISELINIKHKLENDIGKVIEIDLLKKQVQDHLPVLIEKFMNDLIDGNSIVTDHEFWRKYEYLGLNLKGWQYKVLLIEVDQTENLDWEEEKGLWAFAISNIAEEIVKEECLAEFCYDKYNRVCGVLSYENEDTQSFELLSISIAEKVREAIESNLKFTVTVGVGNPYKEMKDVQYSYKEANFAIRNKITEGMNKVISYNDIACAGFCYGVYTPEERSRLIVSMRLFDEKEIRNTLERIFLLVKERNPSYESIVSICIEILSTCFELIAESGMNISNVFPKSMSVFEELQYKKTIHEIRLWIEDTIIKVSQTVCACGRSRNSHLVADIKNYICNNFSDTEFKGENISKQFFMNYSYVSHVFKKEMGHTINEFLTEIRVNKSKEMMDEGAGSIYEIAEKVGYNDTNYFSRCFKKIYGMTPTKYIESRNKK